MTTITVYPAKPSALTIARFRTDRPALTSAGAPWPVDGFTASRLSDGSVTSDPEKALRSAEPEAAAEPTSPQAGQPAPTAPTA